MQPTAAFIVVSCRPHFGRQSSPESSPRRSSRWRSSAWSPRSQPGAAPARRRPPWWSSPSAPEHGILPSPKLPPTPQIRRCRRPNAQFSASEVSPFRRSRNRRSLVSSNGALGSCIAMPTVALRTTLGRSPSSDPFAFRPVASRPRSRSKELHTMPANILAHSRSDEQRSQVMLGMPSSRATVMDVLHVGSERCCLTGRHRGG